MIESLTVISIIGILTALTIYGLAQIRSRARDTERKSDLFVISQGFESRKLDKTCNNTGQYSNVNIDGVKTAISNWADTQLLITASNELNSCSGSFVSAYLSSIPKDPSPGYLYYYNLSPDLTHYRLAASLEVATDSATISGQTCQVQSDIWTKDPYKGQSYFCSTDSGRQIPLGSRPYNYYIGQ